MNLTLKKKKHLTNTFLSLLCDNHSSKTKEMLDFRCSYLPVWMLSTYAGKDAKRVSPHISSELCKCASRGRILWKKTQRPLICLDLKVRALTDLDELDPGTLLWEQHWFLPLLLPLSVLQWPTRPCWQELSAAQLQAGMLLLVRFSLLSLQAAHGNLHWQWHSVLWFLNSWRSIRGSNVYSGLSKAWKSSWALFSLSDWKLLVKQKVEKPEFWAVVSHN